MNHSTGLKVGSLILALVQVLLGCTMIPKYERPASPVAAQYPGAARTRIALAASDIAWEDFFAEQRLKRLIKLALATNRDLRLAILDVEQSRAQYRITRSAIFPTVQGTGSFSSQYSRSGAGTFPNEIASASGSMASPSYSGVTTNQWSASIGTSSYELDLFGRLRSLNNQALEKYFATEEARRSAQISLVTELATEYFTLRELEGQLDLARRTLTAVQKSYDLNKAGFDAGESNELDLRTAEGQVKTAKINVLTYERERAEAVDDLVLLVGQPLPGNLPAATPFDDPDVLVEIPAGLPSALVQRRPDILEAEHTLKAANANIGAARAAFFPTITLTSSLGTTSSQLSTLFHASTGIWTFAPEVTLPIFTGGKNRADLDSAKVSTRIEVANYEKAIQTAFREVSDALVATSSYAQQIKAEAELINAQQARYTLAMLRYRQGEDTYLNVLSAQQDLYSAQRGLFEARLNKITAQISLYKALGGGWK